MTDDIKKALEAVALHERTVNQIFTLAVEYDEKAITAERFADRVVQILTANYEQYAKKP